MAKGAQKQLFSFQDSGAPPTKNARKHKRSSSQRGSKPDGKKKSLGGSLGQKLESHFQRESGHHHQRDPIQQRHYAMGGGEREKEECSVGGGSLTYSASSSMGGSNAGESTDSSFADIMKVLDLDNSSEIAALMAREGVTDMSTQEYVQNVQAQAQARRSYRAKGSEASVAHSLAYSEDGESTIADQVRDATYGRYGVMPNTMYSGQPSDSHGPDGGGFGNDGAPITRAATDESDLVAPSRVHEGKAHKPKSESMKEYANRGKKPEVSPNKSKAKAKNESSRSSTPDTTASSNSMPPRSSPPPRAKPAQRKIRKDRSAGGEKAEAWYSQWWMCGFSDALRDVVGSFTGDTSK